MLSWSYYNDAGYLSAELVAENPRIALYGFFQVGKSTLINCLLNHYAALTGKGLATTSLTARYRYGVETRLQYRRENSELANITIEQLGNISSTDDMCFDGSFHLEAREPSKILKHCDLIDTPGFNADATDTTTALSILGNVNYCLFVIPNRGLHDSEREILSQISAKSMPISVIMNCSEGRRTEKWLPKHELNQKILSANQAQLSSVGIRTMPLGGEQIFACNALFYWSQQDDFDKSKTYIDRGDTVIKHIEELLREEKLSTDRENVVTLSRIPKLVECLKARIKSYNPVKHSWR